jgi:hypothetical protein
MAEKIVITRTTLKEIKESFERFEEEYRRYAEYVSEIARFWPLISQPKLRDAHHFWCQDLDRVENRERLPDGLDHFKCCGHLAYWLRRTAPVMELYDDIAGYDENVRQLEPGGQRHQLRELLVAYTNEYLAFDWSYQICLYYERMRPEPEKNPRADGDILTRDYVRTLCHFLKCKNVSPHALFLIFRSLFV